MNKKLISITGCLAFLAACSSQKVNFDYDRQPGFSSYETYAWHDGENTLADEFPLAHERFTAAVDRDLSGKGLRKVDSSPDVFVTYSRTPRRTSPSIRITSATAMAPAGTGAAWV